MTKVEHILHDVQTLSADEQRQFFRLLAAQTLAATGADEAATGARGLAAWTESAREEDWSGYYPEGLGNDPRTCQ